MSARKWPIYTMEVGEAFLAVNPPKRFLNTIGRYQARSGKVFRTRIVGISREVLRVA